jgi:hypothetical protein
MGGSRRGIFQDGRRPTTGSAGAWRGFYIIITKEYMENLKTESIKIRVNDGMEEYVADEKDKEIFKLSHLNTFIEKIKTLS